MMSPLGRSDIFREVYTKNHRALEALEALSIEYHYVTSIRICTERALEPTLNRK